MILDCNPFNKEIDDARESTKSVAEGIQDVSLHLYTQNTQSSAFCAVMDRRRINKRQAYRPRYTSRAGLILLEPALAKFRE